MDIFARIESAAHEGDFGLNPRSLPSVAQLKHGNYKKGRFEWAGLKVAIEQPRNSYREGVDPSGKAWRTRLAAHYGYLVGTRGMDGDPIDCFFGIQPESEKVYAINQVDPATGRPDELKLMLGFNSMLDARRAYLESYDRGWKGLGSIIPMTVSQLKWWLKYGNHKAVLTKSALPHDQAISEIDDMTQVAWDSAANPVGTDIAGIIYQIRRDDADGLMLDAATAEYWMEGSESAALDALVVEYAKVERKMTQLQAVMGAASGSVTPVAMQVTPPFKQRGTTQVASIFELSDGQTVSVFMHNPDLNPKKIGPQDELISWKWMLNKKDITILVAPEKGIDLNVREVARRIMKLAEKNSAKFVAANTARAGKLAAIEGLKADAEAKTATLEGLNAEIVDLTAKVEAKRAAKPTAASGKYRYAMVNRPAGMGALPSGLIFSVEPRPAPGEPHYDMARHGILVTDRMLTDDETKSFELAPILDEAATKELAAKIAERLSKYAVEYVEMYDAKDDAFAGAVAQQVAKAATSFRPSFSLDYLVESVAAILKQGIEAAKPADADELPAGWTESTPGGMATNRDPVDGGIVDKSRADGLWFVIFNREDMKSIEGLPSRKAAFEAFFAALYNNTKARQAIPERAQAVKDQLALLGWQTSATSRKLMVTIDGSVYGLSAVYEGSDGIPNHVFWKDDGSNLRWDNEPGLLPQDMAAKIDSEFRKAIADARAAVRLDPTSPEGYAAIRNDQAKLEANQDELDSFFQGRIVAVRNALRELGWDGAKYKELTKNGARLVPKYQQVGAGANIVGVVYTVAGENTKPGAEDGVRDDLSITPAELAAEINYFVKTENATETQEDPLQLVDAAYKFVSATDKFKRFLAASVKDQDYSPFASAVRMDKSAQKNGALIDWGFFGDGDDRGSYWNGNVMKDGKLVGRVDLGADGKAMVYVGESGDTRVEYAPGKTFMYSEEDGPAMIDALFAGMISANADGALAEAKAYLQAVIDGAVDYFDTGLADKLTALYEAHNGDADFDAMFERAANAYSDAMIAAAKKAMA